MKDLQNRVGEHIDMLLKEAKTPKAFNQLDEIIEKIESEFKVNLIKYKHQVKEMRQEYYQYRNQANGFYK